MEESHFLRLSISWIPLTPKNVYWACSYCCTYFQWKNWNDEKWNWVFVGAPLFSWKRNWYKKRSKIIGVCCHSNFLMICIQYSSSTYEIYIRTRTRRAHGTCSDETVASICSSGCEEPCEVSWGLVQARKHDVRATRLHMSHRPHTNTNTKIDTQTDENSHYIPCFDNSCVWFKKRISVPFEVHQ